MLLLQAMLLLHSSLLLLCSTLLSEIRVRFSFGGLLLRRVLVGFPTVLRYTSRPGFHATKLYVEIFIQITNKNPRSLSHFLLSRSNFPANPPLPTVTSRHTHLPHRPSTNPTMEAKKRRRVAFASTDVGVEANECIKAFLVGKKEEVSVKDAFPIDPIDLNQFFDNEGKIYGYQDLKINIFVSTVSFHAYADINFQSKTDGGKGITDLQPALQKMLGEALVEKKDDFLQSFSAGVDYVRNVLSNGEILHRETTKGDDSKASNQLKENDFTVEHQVIRMSVDSMPVGELYCRLVPLVLLLVDGSSPIDITDPKWEIYFVVENKTNQHGDVCTKLLGFAAVYRFFYYPDSSRLRMSQILVLPPYQGQGHGRLLLKVLNSVALSENVYDVTVEEPSDYLQHVRTCIDIHRLLAFEPIKHAISSVASRLKQENLQKKTCTFQSDPPSTAVDDVRKSLKITKKQFQQCWEILIYLDLHHIHSDARLVENYKTLITDRTKESILGKDAGDTGKQVIEVPNDYGHEMTFVMFRPSDNVKLDNVNAVSAEIEENQTTQEEQLQQLVNERMKEIVEVAQKVSLHGQ